MKKIFALLLIVIGLVVFFVNDNAYAANYNVNRVDWKVMTDSSNSTYIASTSDPNNTEWIKVGDQCKKIIFRNDPNKTNKYTYIGGNSSQFSGCVDPTSGGVAVNWINNSKDNEKVIYHWINSDNIERYNVGDIPATVYTKTSTSNGVNVYAENSSTCPDTIQITAYGTLTKALYTGRSETSGRILYGWYYQDWNGLTHYYTIDNTKKIGDCYEGKYQGGGELATISISGGNNQNNSPKDFSGSLAGFNQGVSTPGGGSDGGGTGTSSCEVEGIGWILCPVINFLASVADVAFSFLADNFLEFKSGTLDVGGNLFKAWSQVLTFANVGLVIFFLIIIFSQITGFGITNYGIKKMLPRLIIVAILMNLSFFIVQIAADVSNILGYSFKNFFSGILQTSNDFQQCVDSGNIGDIGGNCSSGLGVAAAGILAGGAAVGAVAGVGGVSAALVILIPILLSAVIALLIIFLILVLRQVLLILLTVIAPIAFLAFLLPNTEGWFKKWYKTLIALLLVFPIIGLIYGLSSFASEILISTGVGSDSTLQQLIGAATLVLPLFLVPVILKKSLDSIPAIAGKVNSLGSKVTGGAKSSAKQGMEKSYLGQKAAYNKQQAAINRAQIQSGTYKGRFGRFNPRNLASGTFGALNGSRLSGEFGNSMTARGASLEQEENTKRDKEAAALIEKKGLSREDIKKLAMGIEAGGLKANEHNRRAAIQQMMATGGVQDVHDVLGSVGTMSPGQRSVTTTSLASSSVNEKAPYLRGVLGDIGSGTVDLDKAARDSIIQGKITPEVLAGMDAIAIGQLSYATLSDPEASKILDDAKVAVLNNELLYQRVGTGTLKDDNIRAVSQYYSP